ncbi:MAG TPA: DUF2391 family protein [Acidobacteriota bacterium]|nr:DUF2391 family protein [Acidobacteriota bacterium]
MGQKISVAKRLDSIEKKLSSVITFQKKWVADQKLVSKSPEKSDDPVVPLPPGKIADNETQEFAELKALESDLKKNLKESPLRRITYKDLTKGMVGAAFAIIGDFAFADGFRLAEHYTIGRSLLLLLTSFLIIVLFIYFTGFRKVDDKFVFRFLPVRAMLLYFSAILVSVAVLFLFDTINFTTPLHAALGTVSSISVLAVLGAGTADLIGKV